ncbi:Gfo/Idh/MocA family protein [Eilatimonas milleporae]|uniref:Putative dehydrogenase n=1 Tax=Eilatimonas milleporae TaxID=911205 RepID=A0A3M0C4M7_9PROT|nr:Gfo/Idh/MocA family oxidoreductase [Eilatimonas milleporae]RMB04774.1 putative dehydrogenase [Eilatimonas milleporae]
MAKGTRLLRIAIAGSGYGLRAYLPHLQRRQPHVRFAGHWRPYGDMPTRDAPALQGPLITAGQGLHALGVDGVIIAVPPAVAEGMALTCVDEGMPCFLEKPVVLSDTAASALGTAARALPVATGYQFPGTASFRALKTLIEEAAVGSIERVSVTWSVQSWAQRNRVHGWKVLADMGGGVFTTLGCHVLHALDWLFGDVRFQSGWVSNAITRSWLPGPDRAANDTAVLNLSAGGAPDISVALSNAMDGPPLHRWDVTGDRGRMIIENTGWDYVSGLRLNASFKDARRDIAVSDVKTDTYAPSWQRLDGFCAAIVQHHCDGDDMLRAGRVVALINMIDRLAEKPQSNPPFMA